MKAILGPALLSWVSLFSSSLVLAPSQAAKRPKPPHEVYDAKTDQTTDSTGDLRTGGLTGMSAEYSFPGHIPAAPAFVKLGVGGLRIQHDESASEESVLKWTQVNEAHIKVGGSEIDVPAVESSKVTENTMAKMLYGNALEESATMQLTLAQFHALASSDGFEIDLGHRDDKGFTLVEARAIKAATVKPLQMLDASLPGA